MDNINFVSNFYFLTPGLRDKRKLFDSALEKNFIVINSNHKKWFTLKLSRKII
jgi:hypothetical protein